MNKSYKSIWNESLGTYVAAAETAVSGGRRVSSGRRARRTPARAGGGFIALEQRIVFDAAVGATVAEVHSDAPVVLNHQEAVDDVSEAADAKADSVASAFVEATPPAQDEQELAVVDNEDDAESSTTVSTASDGDDAEAREEASPEAALGETDDGEDALDAGVDVSGPADPDTDEAGQSADDAVSDELGELAIDDGVTERTEIIFVDPVAKDVVEHLSWHPGEIYVLDADRDGVEQMAEILQGRTGVDAIHVISHGSAGRLDLGTAELTVNTMADAYADELAIIRAALSEEADILLYGCDIGADEAGNAFLSALAEATGADVLASSDDTGSEALGGNWVLETQVGGSIETVTITAEEYAGVLTTAVSNGNGAVLASAGKGIYSIDLATGKATLLTTVPAFVGGANTGTTQNSLAVDQANGLIYYAAEWATNAIANDALFAYDYINDVHILITDNIASYGVRLGERGVGSGGAVFANGTLYLGMENNYGGQATGGTATLDSIYRISFTNAGRTIASATVLVGQINAEWGDLGYDPVNNHLISSASNASGTAQIVRYNATTGAQVSVQTSPTGAIHQVSTDSNGNVYLVTGGDTSQATIRLYNPATNTVGPVLNVTTNGTTNLPGSIADAAGWVPPTATIGDRIFADANGDGVQNAGETGIAGVTVALYDDVNNNGIVDANDRLLGTDTTNASGEYLFTGVLPGNYIVRVTDTANVLGADAVYTTTGGNTNANADITRVGSSYLSADFGVNRPPANTVPAAQSTPEDAPLVFNAGAGNAITVADPDGGTLTTTVQVTQGTFTLGSTAGVTVAGNGTGSVTITGNAAAINAALNNAYYSNTPDYHGAAQLTITTSDGRPGYADTDTVAITVTPVVDIEDDTASTTSGQPVNIAVLGNDTFEGTPSVTSTSTPANGSATILPNGTITYTANAGFVGTDTFTYTVTSGGRTETATVTVTVGANGTTITGDTSDSGTEDGGPITGQITASDLDGLPANPYSVTGNPTHGTASINASGNWVYTPNADYNGPDSFEVTVTDALGNTTTQIIDVTVTPVVDITDDAVTTDEDTPITFNVLTGTNGATADSFEGSPQVTAVTQPVEGGAVTFDASGNVTFVPTPDWSGTTSFQYTVTSGGVTETATVTIMVNPVNDVPVATPIAGQTNVDADAVASVDVSGAFSDPEGDTLTYTASGLPPGLTINTTTGVISGTIDRSASQGGPGSNGVYSVTVTANDGNGGTVDQTFTWTVTNPPPVANDDMQSAAPEVPVVVDLLGNDTDPDNDLPLTVVDATLADPTQGTLVRNADGSYTFTSAPGVSGAVVINYTIEDQDGGQASATHTVNVANQPPQPQPEVPGTPTPTPRPPAPPTVVLPEQPKPDVPSHPGRDGGDPTNVTRPVPVVIPVIPTLPVSETVGASAVERDLANAGLTGYVDAATAGEAGGRVADSLLFADQGHGPRLIQEHGYGELQTFVPALHVQHAVRHEPVTTDHGLFVQRAVRASQLEAQIRDATIQRALNSAAPGVGTLLDPFAVGAPRPEVADQPQAEADANAPQRTDGRGPSAQADQADGVAQPAHAAADGSAAGEPQVPAKPRAAAGFRAQIERAASSRHAGARPMTRATAKA